MFALALLAGAAGCRTVVPPETPSAGPAVSPPVSAPRPVVTKPPLQDVKTLPADRDVKFAVRAPGHTLIVVQHYDAELAKRGWKKRSEGGDRKWLSTGASVGPTDAFAAAWVDPRTGRLAELNLWHTAAAPDVEQGTFEIRAKDQ